ncbi:MAG TPA: hypothetical protein VJ843_04250 [Candidatus Saccharimonadales bacterium]|nr:hypothetical protein [Candidatus Saccharimonadales bacterium]
MSIRVIEPGKPVLLQEGTGTLDVVLSWKQEGGARVTQVGMYELIGSDHFRNVVQLAPPASPGALYNLPYVELSAQEDARGMAHHRETLRINLVHAYMLNRVQVFAHAQDDATWSQVRSAAVSIGHPTQGNFDFPLGRRWLGLPSRGRRSARSCMLFTLDRVARDVLKLTPHDTYLTDTPQEIIATFKAGPASALKGVQSHH